MRQPYHPSVYAIRGSSSVYHLLYPNQDFTLCGFRVEKHGGQISPKATLHVVEFVPPNRELCKQCDKMKNRRSGNSVDPGPSSPNPGFMSSDKPEHSAFQFRSKKQMVF
jgi:hypothetical protein